MSARRSKRIRRRRKLCNQACVRSTTDLSKATAVGEAASRDAGGNAALVKNASVFVVVITPVSVDAAGTAQRPPTHAANRYDGLNQRNNLGDVVMIGDSQDCRDRCSVGVGGEVVLGSWSRSISGIRASFFARPNCANRRPRARNRSCRPPSTSPGALGAIDPIHRLAANRVACANN